MYCVCPETRRCPQEPLRSAQAANTGALQGQVKQRDPYSQDSGPSYFSISGAYWLKLHARFLGMHRGLIADIARQNAG